ncbi:DUF1211 domain-containing protein [Lactobacillus reuteri]|uniref:DUF1211 domain-containing protein n=1 Tax=Limosilactobacillus reuteri TaxID=1598 RepID=A0A6L5P3B1_LIMRT|nr:DUF1211 domain-containing protein [Limosilactobacillus reuteri]
MISFFRIATTWYNHHYLFTNARWTSRRAFWLNIGWLLCCYFRLQPGGLARSPIQGPQRIFTF